MAGKIISALTCNVLSEMLNHTLSIILLVYCLIWNTKLCHCLN